MALLPTCADRSNAIVQKKDEEREDDLALFMRRSINGAWTRVSFSIFHDDQATPEDRMNTILGESRKLQEAAAKLSLFQPRLFPENPEEFEEYVALLRQYANGLADSASEQDIDEMKVWFWHVKNVCESCHKIYRFGDQAPIRS